MWFKLYNLERLYLIKKKNFVKLKLNDNKYLEKKALALNFYDVKNFVRNYDNYYYFFFLDKKKDNNNLFKVNNPFFYVNIFFKKQYYMKNFFIFKSYQNFFSFNFKRNLINLNNKFNIDLINYSNMNLLNFYLEKKFFNEFKKDFKIDIFFKKDLFSKNKNLTKKTKSLFLNQEFFKYKMLHFKNNFASDNLITTPLETKSIKISLLNKKKKFLVLV